MRLPIFIALFSLIPCALFSDIEMSGEHIESSTGQIFFDANDDGTADSVIDSNSNFGIGTLIPSSNLHVQGNLFVNEHLILTELASAPDTNSGNGLVYYNAGNVHFINGDGTSTNVSRGSGTWKFNGDEIYYNTDNVGIGNTNPSYRFHVTGPDGSSGVLRVDAGGNDNIILNPSNAQHVSVNLNTSNSLRNAFAKFFNSGVNEGWEVGYHQSSQRFSIQWSSKGSLGSGVLGNDFVILPGSGNLIGIGTNSPTAQLEVLASSASTPGFTIKGAASQTSNLTQWQNSAGSSLSIVDANGNIGIGTTSASANLTLVGNMLSTGNILPSSANTYDLGSLTSAWNNAYIVNTVHVSDRRLKEKITPLTLGLEEIMKLKPVTFHWKNTPKGPEKIGLIAQEVEEVLGDVVQTDSGKEGIKGVQYVDIIPVLIKAVQELKQENLEMKNREAWYRKKMDRLERSIEKLKEK